MNFGGKASIMKVLLTKKQIILVFAVFFILSGAFVYCNVNNYFTSQLLIYNQMQEQIPSGEIIKGQVIEQELTIPYQSIGNKITLEIYLSTYSRKNNTSLEFTLQQGKNKDSILINTKNIKDNAFQKIVFVNKSFEKGKADLIITGVTGEIGNTITAWKTKDISQGNMTIDGVSIPDSGLVYKLIIPVKNQINLFLILFLLIYVICVLKILNKNILYINLNFLLSFLFTILITCLKYPSLTTSAEMWAEAATNYFNNAQTKGWIDNIKILDAGYLPLFPRLIALFLVKILSINSQFAIISQVISTLFLAIFIAFINLNEFRALIRSDFLRFMVSVSFGMGLFLDYELHTFINFSYLGIFPCFLMLFYKIENLKKPTLVIATLFTVIIVLSKAFFILLLPFYLILFGLNFFYKRNLKSIIYYGTALMATFIQFIIVVTNRATWVSKPAEEATNTGFYNLVLIVKMTMIYYIKILYSFIFKLSNSNDSKILFVLLLLFTIVAILYFYYIRKKINKNVLCFFIATQIIAITALLLSMTLPYVRLALVWDKDFSVPNTRSFLFSNVLIFIGVLVFSLYFLKNRITQIIIGALLIFLYSLNGYSSKDPYFYGNMSFSHWSNTYPMFKSSKGCAPINPYPWILCNDMSIQSPPIEATDTSLINQFDIVKYKPESKTLKVKGFIMDKGSPFNEKIIAIAYDSEGNEIGNSLELTESFEKYGYFIFGKEVTISKIVFYNEKYTPILLKQPKIYFFGN